MKFITIKESNTASDLMVFKHLLEKEGVECRLKNEMPDQVTNQTPSPFEELQVAESDMEKAVSILRESGY
jgi:hypothetical protein